MYWSVFVHVTNVNKWHLIVKCYPIWSHRYLWRWALLPSPACRSRGQRAGRSRGVWPRSLRRAPPSPPWSAGASETRTWPPARLRSSVRWRRARFRPACTDPRSPAPSGVCRRWGCLAARTVTRCPAASGGWRRRCGSVGSPVSEAPVAGLWWFWNPGAPWTIWPCCQRIAHNSDTR